MFGIGKISLNRGIDPSANVFGTLDKECFGFCCAGLITPPPPFIVAANDASLITNISGLTYQQGMGPSSPSDPFKILALGLSPAAGDITVTMSSNIEVYDGSMWQSSPFTVAYTGGGITTALIYMVRLKSGLSVNSYTESVVLSGANASDWTIVVTGSVTSNVFLQDLVLALNMDSSSGTTVIDSSGRGNNGTLSGLTIPTWGPGIVNNGLNFKGGTAGAVSSKILIPTSVDWTFGTGDFTMCCWVVPNNTIGFWCPFDLGYAQNAGVLLEYQVGQGFNIYINGGSVFTWSSFIIIPGSRHMLVIRRMSGTLQFFIDNVIGANISSSQDILNSGQDIVIGQYSGGETLDGVGDIFYFWRRGLSNSELSQMYNSGNGLQPA